ncbi:MAG: hypothetical protein GY898_18855 [Proteobacteria bacterium]|nr:hypothetical protein [Pseudomonadota bacterium]
MQKFLGLMCVGALCATPALAEGATPDAFTMENAMVVHLSTGGLDALGESIAGVLPVSIEATGLSGEVDCDEETEGVLTYSADDIQINLYTETVEITPEDSSLNIAMTMTLWSEPVAITTAGTCVVELNETCTLALPPTWLDVDVGIDLVLEDGALNAQVDHLWFSHGNFGNPVGTGCVLGDALETMQGYGVDLIGTILDGVLDEQIAELETQLEEAIGGLTGALDLGGEIDILGTPLTYEIEAAGLDVSSTGVELAFSSKFTSPFYGTCVPQDSGPYLASAHDAPLVTGLIPDTTVPYHLGIVVSEDMLNQALYAAWQGGALCLSLADLADLELTTDYLALAEEELVADLWPEPKTLDVRVVPVGPPLVDFGAGPGLTAQMAIDVYGDELDRDTRFWSNGLYADAGIGLELDDGTLLIDLDFDLESHLGITVDYNEWLPSDIPESFAALLPDLVGAAFDLESLVPEFTIPAIYGITLADLDMRAVGAEEDYLGVYAWVNPDSAIPIEIGPIELSGIGCGDTGDGGEISIPGCDSEDGGCGADSGCDSTDGGCGGCDSGEDSSCGSCSVQAGFRLNGWSVMTLLVPMLLLSRRRR